MKKILIYTLLILLTSCISKHGITSKEFRNIYGVLYYEKPETGSVVDIVFLPYDKNIYMLNCKNLDSLKLVNGIKFSISNGLLKDKLYSIKPRKVILKGMLDRTVFLISNAKIFFHTEKSAMIGSDVLEKDLRLDTLIQIDKLIEVKHRYARIVLDSLTVN